MYQRKHLKWLSSGRFFVGLASVILALVPVPALALTANSITPASGSVKGGNTVTIKGSGFQTEAYEQFQDLAAGVEHAVLLSDSGHVWTVGRNSRGQLGANLPTSGKLSWAITPVDITPRFHLDSNDEIVGVYSGDYYSFAVSQNHRVFAWGENRNGQLGAGDRKDRAEPVEITDNFGLSIGDYVERIAAGVDTSYAVTSNGQMYVWGNADDYMDGTSENKDYDLLKPTTAPQLLEDVDDISVGYKTGIVAYKNNYVMTWGRNKSGELGRGDVAGKNYITDADEMSFIQQHMDLYEDDYVIDVEAGYGAMAAITKNNRVLVWGDNSRGMLGLPEGEKASLTDDNVTSTPKDIAGYFDIAKDDKFTQISLGNSQGLALTQYGRVFAWGQNNYGQLGKGDTETPLEPVEITDQFKLSDDVQIAKVLAAGAGDADSSSYSYALDSDGNVYAWGGDAFGKPGINAIANTNEPKMISDRLSAEVPNIASVKFGDYTATVFAVAGDETIKVIVPPADVAGKVNITVIDNQNSEADVPQAYNYLEDNPGELPDDSDSPGDDQNPDDPDNPDNPSDNNNGQDKVDDNKNTGDNVKEDGSNDEDIAKLLNKLGVKDVTTLQKLLTSGSDVGSSSNIKAPNTGCAISRN